MACFEIAPFESKEDFMCKHQDQDTHLIDIKLHGSNLKDTASK